MKSRSANQRLKTLTTLAFLLSLEIILSYLEGFLPTFLPGVKLGLANAITLFLLALGYFKESFFLLLTRVFVVSFLRGTFLSYPFYMSLASALTSYSVMLLLSGTKQRVSYVSISLISGFVHSLTQMVVMASLLSSVLIFAYFPLLLLLSLTASFLTGLLVETLLKKEFIKRYLNEERKSYSPLFVLAKRPLEK